MSQTLSLEPGKYSLFITPPVAGVDFTGTPTPSVSYQWRKNGAAVSGQTAATISGVLVGEIGGTVDLADGDTISIDIILTNPVSVVIKAISAVIDASIPAPVISPISIRLVSEPTTPVSTIPNASIGSQIMVASTGSVSVVTTPPLLPTYQWRRGFAAIAGANSPTYTLQAADADSIIDCVVSVSNNGGSASSTASVIVGTVADAGWTQLTPAVDSRLIYVSSDGDDVAAANVKGRGYYLPSDPEIGGDPTNPAGSIVAYRDVQQGLKRIRAGGAPEWVMFRRGEVFDDSSLAAECYWQRSEPASFAGGHLFTWGWTSNGQAVAGCTAVPGAKGPSFSYEAEVYCGRGPSEPFVIAAWGPPSSPRPVVASAFRIGGATWGRFQNAFIASLDIRGEFDIGIRNGTVAASQNSNVVVEDCRMRGFNVSGGPVTLRRCTISGAWASGGNPQGTFVYDGGVTPAIKMIECVYDWNGFKENPSDATTWTANVVSTGVVGAMAQGAGRQPTRNALDRNVYVSTGDGINHNAVSIQGSIFSRGGGGGTLQMRQGGICERNLFVWNEDAGYSICGPGVLFEKNCVLHDDHMLPPGGWGMGPATFNSENWNNQGSGWSLNSDLNLVLADNCITHFHRISNGGSMLDLYNASTTHFGGIETGRAIGTLLSGTIIARTNCIHADRNPAVRILNWGTLDDLQFGGNTIASVSGRLVESSATHMSSLAGKGSVQYAIGDSSVGGNKYFSTLASPFGSQTFAQWQATRAGVDSASAFFSDFAAFKVAAGWTDPDRDIVSYMQSVDPLYVVNEDVYIDEDADVKQASRQKVWEVLSNSAAYPDNAWWQTNGLMSEAKAKQTARRYHAFITFIQRAKENRKGAWDSRWTAEAVNNHIRAGFGKSPVTGAYDSRSLADRILDYTT